VGERGRHQHHWTEAGIFAADRHHSVDADLDARAGVEFREGYVAKRSGLPIRQRRQYDWLLLLHLAATETYDSTHTFESKAWDSWPAEVKKKWDIPMELGEPARKAIKGNNLDYYLNILHETREHSLAEFKKRDDSWLRAVDKDWPWGPTNNYCKWFHVCEHESNHNGQIKFLAKRLPGAKAGKE